MIWSAVSLGKQTIHLVRPDIPRISEEASSWLTASDLSSLFKPGTI
jgi:hypothetical protein